MSDTVPAATAAPEPAATAAPEPSAAPVVILATAEPPTSAEFQARINDAKLEDPYGKHHGLLDELHEALVYLEKKIGLASA
jgi:hypothetical protein